MAVFAITGTPGTGKTTIARIVGKKLGWTVIELNQLVHERQLYSGLDEERGVQIVDMKKVQKALDNIEARDLIIESHYSHEMKCDYVIVLRLSPEDIRKRGQARGWTEKKIEENVLSEIMEVCKTEAMETGKKVFEVNTTGKSPSRVGMEVISIIKRVKKIKGKI